MRDVSRGKMMYQVESLLLECEASTLITSPTQLAKELVGGRNLSDNTGLLRTEMIGSALI